VQCAVLYSAVSSIRSATWRDAVWCAVQCGVMLFGVMLCCVV
jgi:hypothetical protein